MEEPIPKKKVGKPAQIIEYKHIEYNSKKYTVGKVKTNNIYVYFVIDDEDYSKIKDYSWHYNTQNYISHNITIDGKQKSLGLHNLIMNRIEFPGRGAKESIDHINRNGLDNRKENLRLSTSKEQRLNQNLRKRKIILPEESGLTADDIPKHIWYIKANGSHGERFAVELNTENISWKTTSSKNVSLKDKLQSAKDQLEKYYITYPYLNPHNTEINNRIRELNNSFNEIVKLVE
jgi:hypothetical protein